ncbi:MAG: YebC/PmpR family DNA-binding transcriptional regulator [Limnochordales bacterium]|nr:YebC/PmpR family DNA-binding transcriptional regulator [Limnochordales bacterium]
MSGHSKWANIKRKKEKVDAARGRIFTRLAREIIVAARQGGGNPEANFRLRIAIENAKKANMPSENIERAIKRGTGELDQDEQWEEVTYEGYGPGGVAVMVEALTGNRNRTASELRYIFSRNGGNLGEAGCVAWLFEKKGVIRVARTAIPDSEDDFLLFVLDAGASDVQLDEEEGVFEIITEPQDLQKVQEALEKRGIETEEASLQQVPKNRVEVTGKDAERVVALLEALEDHDDVQNVYSNASFEESDLAVGDGS